MAPVLVAFAGLSGVGKTTIARALALSSGALYLRVDTIEQAIRIAGGDVGPAGYGVAMAMAADNLTLGRDVIVDGVSPVAESRDGFAACARTGGARLLDVEVVCSNVAEHRRRVETRVADIAGLVPPTWEAVSARRYAPWTTPRVVIDTARRPVGEAVALLLRQMDET